MPVQLVEQLLAVPHVIDLITKVSHFTVVIPVEVIQVLIAPFGLRREAEGRGPEVGVDHINVEAGPKKVRTGLR